jgi:hypothetical protein
MRAWLLLLVGCTAVPVGENTAALGEPNGDFPNYDERVVLYATNRARVDPAKEGWSSYPAQPPLQWNYQLNESSRAHSTDMRDTPCFQHNSCNGTDCFARVNSYYTGQWSNEGENISAGVPDGLTAVHNWLYEIGAAAGETGHRDNIFSKDFTLMGTGFAAGGSQYTNYWTQDFIGTGVTRPAMTDGIHFPKTGSSVTFGVTWSDAAAPAKISVVVDGACHDLTLARGNGGQAAYEAMLSIAGGCHAYYFRGVSTKKTWLYPDTGSLQVGCSTLFASTQAHADCDTTAAPSPDLSQLPDMASSHEQEKPDMTTTTTHPGNQPDLSLAGIIMPGDPGTIPPTEMRAQPGCSLSGRPSIAWPFALLLLAFALRRRLR